MSFSNFGYFLIIAFIANIPRDIISSSFLPETILSIIVNITDLHSSYELVSFVISTRHAKIAFNFDEFLFKNSDKNECRPLIYPDILANILQTTLKF